MHSPTEQSAVSLVNSDWRALLDLFSTGDYGLLLSNKIYFMVTMFVIWIVFAIMLVRQFFQANALRRDSERKQNQPVEDGLNMSA
jgi:membrane protein implicated in regulation of membrane protease activity